LREVGSFATPAQVQSIALLGNIAFLALGDAGILILDISDPAAPVQRGLVPGSCYDLATHGEHVWAVQSGLGLRALRYVAPDQLVPVAAWTDMDRCYSFAIDGDHLVICDPEVGVHLLDISSLPGIRQLNYFTDVVQPTFAAFYGDRILVNQYSRTIATLDPNAAYDPPATTAVFETGDIYDHLQAAGEFVYGTFRDDMYSLSSALRIIESDPLGIRPPRLRGALELPNYPNDLEIHDGLAYVAAYQRGVAVIDCRNPDTPVQIGGISLPYYTHDVAVQDGWIYAAIDGHLTTDGRLIVIDARDPRDLTEFTSIQAPRRLTAAKVAGNLVVAGAEDGRLFTFSSMTSTEEAPPELRGEVQVLVHPIDDIVLLGSIAFAVASDGLVSVDCSDIDHPVLLDRWSSTASMRQATWDGHFLYIATFFGMGVAIFDVSDPSNLRLVGCTPSPGDVCSVAVCGGQVYSGQLSGRVDAFPAQCDDQSVATEPTPDNPLPPVRIPFSVSPVPANPAVTIRFQLDRAGSASLLVHDARGRVVAELAAGQLASGPHTFTWNGLDDAGHTLPSGVYLVRLSTEDVLLTKRAVLVR
jgi:hypothetical protein